MANTTFPQTPAHSMDWNIWRAKASTWAIPVGRCLFALIFVFAAFGHFTSETINMGASHGVPWAEFLVPASGVMALAGGLSVMFGYHARIGALLLLAFLLPVTLVMHNFWAYSNPAEATMQMTHFMKNVSMMGGALFVCFYGAGPMSIDHRAYRNGL